MDDTLRRDLSRLTQFGAIRQPVPRGFVNVSTPGYQDVCDIAARALSALDVAEQKNARLRVALEYMEAIFGPTPVSRAALEGQSNG
jgi:hypothetical protein